MPRPGRRADDSGAAAVEMALVTPFILFFVFAILESGMFMMNYLSLEESTRDASRELAIRGAAPTADVEILDTIEATFDDISPDVIQRIVIYRAVARDDGPPESCKTGPLPGSVADQCTIYTIADFEKSLALLDCAWCPADRVPGELIGLWVEIDMSSVTGLFPGQTLANHSVLPLERDSSGAQP